jgi:hypothetical protein
MKHAHLCLGVLRDLGRREPEASEDAIDVVLHEHLCAALDDEARLALLEFVSSESNYENIRNAGRHAFWERVLVVVLDKHRILTRAA